MKQVVIFIVCFWMTLFLMHGQVQVQVDVNITPTAYFKSSVDRKMKQWLQQKSYETASEYEDRVSEANQKAIQKDFEIRAIAEYKELFLKTADWNNMKIVSYDNNKQAFLIQPAVCAIFMMPVPQAEAQGFQTEFPTLMKTDVDFSFSGDVVKFSKLTFVNSRGKTYVYDIANAPIANAQIGNYQQGDKRMALVIGNSAYRFAPLANPVNDATDMATKLKNLGFNVILLTDKTKSQMERAIDDFGNKALNYDVALFFYAGHAVQYNGKNYLIPVDIEQVQKGDERNVEYDCTPVDRVLSSMEYSKSKVKIMVLDACRDNLYRSYANSGLSSMSASKGTFIAYSTTPGMRALDGTGRNSPYTTELLKQLDVKGLRIEDIFKRVREGVLARTGGQQLPWDQSSIIGDFIFNY